MRRGELWTVAGGVYASKPRPAVIIQDDRFDATDSVTVIPLTTTAVDAPMIRVSVPGTPATGLREDSFAMIDKLTTVRRSHIEDHLGRLPAVLLIEMERSMIALLGLAD